MLSQLSAVKYLNHLISVVDDYVNPLYIRIFHLRISDDILLTLA